MTLNIFVHPFFPEYKDDSRNQVELFTHNMVQLISNGGDALLLSHGLENKLLLDFPKNRTLQTVYFKYGKYGNADARFSGYVAKDDWKKFVKLIDNHSDFIVHGAYLGRCVNEFSRQLFAYLKMGEHWTNISGNEGNTSEILNRQDVVYASNVFEGKISSSGIKLGAVLPPDVITHKKPRIIEPRFGSLPFGNDTYQMMDKSTYIYHKEGCIFI